MSGSNSLRMRRPILGITLGDPTGVGPENIVQALAQATVQSLCTPVVIGRPFFLEKAAQLCGLRPRIRVLRGGAEFRDWLAQSRAERSSNTNPELSAENANCGELDLVCVAAGNAEDEGAIGGTIDARGGQAAYDALVLGARACMDGRLDGLVTAPLQKKALHLAGHDWPGHTELLAHLCGVEQSAMMLYLPPGKPQHGGPAGLGVVHVTLHMAMREIFGMLTPSNVFDKIALTHQYFSQLRVGMGLAGRPRIAVAALNPHGGESGRFGQEEQEVIVPAVERAQRSGIDATGPHPVDTLMPRAARGDFDAVVAMHHDQGHIALKLIDMYEAVNITLGLPIIRTSVAHGTAHDIAWENLAQCGGMVQAILAASRLATERLARQ
jgi:4-hydroxythreonine-4-phosphate dehydrogenase